MLRPAERGAEQGTSAPVSRLGARAFAEAFEPGEQFGAALLEPVGLNGANLNGANLSGADLDDADLDDADLRDAENLTQTQLDKACGKEQTQLPKLLERLTLKPCGSTRPSR